MSSVDNRVVQMDFNNKRFEENVHTSISSLDKLKQSLNLDSSAKSLSNLEKTANSFSLGTLASGVDTIAGKFSTLGIMGVTALQNITNQAVNAGKKIVAALTIDPIKTGFAEYETQINAVQTILANTESKGTTLSDVNKALDELNTYADKTIYNFTEMTKNIGTFTAAGVDLDKSVSSIQGIANLAAVSGSTSQQASTAMYQLSQALASGTVKLMDWNSVVNAGMGGQVFQDALKRTATVMGTNVDAIIKKYGSFRESLRAGWITTEVLTETLNQFTMSAKKGTKEYENYKKSLKEKGYSDDQIESILKMGLTATEAATKVKTFTQLFDTLKESAQSGWTQSWELIVGNFGEAKEFLTEVSETIGGMLNGSAEVRNKILAGGLQSNWTKLTEKIQGSGIELATFENKVTEVAKKHKVNIEKIVQEHGSLQNAFKEGAISSDILKEAVANLSTTLVDLSKIEGTFKSGSVGKDVKQLQQALSSLGHDVGSAGADGIFGSDTAAAVKAFQELKGLEATGVIDEKTLDTLKEATSETKNLTKECDKLIENITKNGGRENLIDALRNSFKALMAIVKPIKQAFTDIFHLDDVKTTASWLYSITERIKEFTSKLTIGSKTADNIKRTFKGLFALLSIGIQIISAVAGGIMDLVRSLLPAGNGILSITGNIGDGIVALDEYLKKNETFKNVVSKIVNILSKVTGAIKSFIGAIAKFVQEFSDGLKSSEDISSRLSLISKIAGILKNVFSSLGGVVKKVSGNIRDFISKTGDEVKNWVGKILDAIGEMDFSTILEGLVESFGGAAILGGVGGAVVLLKKCFDTLKSIIENFIGDGGVAEKVLDILDGVRECLEKFQASLKAKIILKIAIAVGILAVSLLTLASIEPKKLAAALGAMTAMFVELFTAMSIFQKLGGKKGFTSMLEITSAMMKLATAVLILSVAIKILSTLDWNQLAVALVGVGVLMMELVAFVAMMDQLNPSEKSIAGLLTLATAIVILSAAMKIIATIDWPDIAKGLLSIGAMLGIIVGFAKAMGTSYGKVLISSGIALGIIAGSMIIFAEALKRLEKVSWSQMAKGLALMAGALGIVAITMKSMKVTALAGAASVLIVAAALMMLVPVLEALSKMENVGKTLLVLAGSLLIIAGAMYLMSTAIPGSIALLIVSAALIVFSTALEKLSNLKMDEIGRALLALGGSLAILAVAMYALTYGIAGAAALLIISAALAIFVPLLQALSTMSLEQIGTAMLALAGVFLVFGVAAAVLTYVIPSMLALSVALALIGVACMAVGIGILALATGLTAIANFGVAAAQAIVQMILTIISMIPTVIAMIGGIIKTLCSMILDVLPVIINTIKTVVLSIVNLITTLLPTIMATVQTIIVSICTLIISVLPTVIQTLTIVLNALCELLITFIPKVLAILTLLLNGILALIVATTPGVVATVVTLLLCVIAGLTVVIPKLLELVALILTEVLKLLVNIIPKLLNAVEQILLAVIAFLLSFVPKLVESALELVVRILEAIAGKLDDVILAATAIALALIEGIVKTIPQVIDAATKMIIDVINGLANSIRENTPKMIAAVDNLMNAIIEAIIMWFTHFTGKGGEIVSKIISGIKTKVSEAKAVAKNLIGDVLQKIKDKIADFKSVGKDAISGLIKGIKDKASKAVEAAKGVVSDALTAAKKLLGIKSPSREFMKVGQFSDEGLVVGLTKYASKVKDAAGSVAQSALDTMSDTIGNISNILNGDVNTDPVIKPVLDLSNVRSGAKEIDSMLANQNTLSIDTNTAGTIAASMNSIQNGNNSSELASAIKGLRKDLANVSNNTYNINGVTYDDGSNITDAVATIVRAAKIGRRV